MTERDRCGREGGEGTLGVFFVFSAPWKSLARRTHPLGHGLHLFHLKFIITVSLHSTADAKFSWSAWPTDRHLHSTLLCLRWLKAALNNTFLKMT